MKKLSGLIFLFACACATTPKDAPSSMKDETSYQETLERHTQFFRKYDGFYETFRAHATLMTPESQTAILKQRASMLDWDQKKLNIERERSQQEMAAQTTIFLQFYTPDTEYDDLNKPNTIWRVYLEMDGRKFEGKARRAKGKPIEFQALYPHFDKFSTPYELTFNVSTADVIRHNVTLILASSLGEGRFTFAPAD